MMIMSWFQKRSLRRLAAKLVIQGPQHQGNIIEYYEVMATAARKEFREDTGPTLAGFLSECHDKALERVMSGSPEWLARIRAAKQSQEKG